MTLKSMLESWAKSDAPVKREEPNDLDLEALSWWSRATGDNDRADKLLAEVQRNQKIVEDIASDSNGLKRLFGWGRKK